MKNKIENNVLKIPFSLVAYPPMKPEIEEGKFEINNLKLELNKSQNKYILSVSNFEKEDEIDDFINNFEFFIKYYTLGREYCAMDFDKADLEPDFITLTLKEVQATETLERFENELNEILNNEYELNDDLKLSLNIFSKYSKYDKKSQFLDLITIIEILTPEYDISENSKENIKSIKKYMKEIRRNFDNESEEYKEFHRYFKALEDCEKKSINASLQEFAKNHANEFSEFESIDDKVKEAYEIRSNIVHGGIISDEFDKYYNFLRPFVGKLLKIMINERKVEK